MTLLIERQTRLIALRFVDRRGFDHFNDRLLGLVKPACVRLGSGQRFQIEIIFRAIQFDCLFGRF